MKKHLAIMLLISLLAPAIAPVVALAFGNGSAMAGEACSTGTHACMEGDRCAMGHRECRMHSANKATDEMVERHGGGHVHHGGEAVPAPPQCDRFYSGCGAGGGPDAFPVNPLETPFLLPTDCLGAALPVALSFSAPIEAYSGPFPPQQERPPSIPLQLHR